MAQIFPESINRVPLYVVAGGAVVAILAALGMWYFFSPEFTDVGYQPEQPVPFSHRLHAGELDMDCRYCHASVEVSAVASIPPTSTCMKCHLLVARDSPNLALVRQSASSGRPIPWIRVHKVPEYAYFDHSAHLRAGVGCSTCHGDVAEMEEIVQVEPLSMKWCLECHRNPEPYLRQADQITNTRWRASEDQAAFAQLAREQLHLEPSTDCTTCHR